MYQLCVGIAAIGFVPLAVAPTVHALLLEFQEEVSIGMTGKTLFSITAPLKKATYIAYSAENA